MSNHRGDDVLRGDDAIARVRTLAHAVSKHDVETYARLESVDSFPAEVIKFCEELDESYEFMNLHVEIRGNPDVVWKVPLDQSLQIVTNRYVSIISSPSQDRALRLLRDYRIP